jgi:DNA-binding winged helix-turn-helix (wHTH) protein
MSNSLKKVYFFEKYSLDIKPLALYFNGKLIEKLGNKPLEILLILLENPNKLVSSEEIIEKVWADNLHGKGSESISSNVLKLNNMFKTFTPNQRFIKSERKKGFMFVGDVTFKIADEKSKSISSEKNDSVDQPNNQPKQKKLYRITYGLFAILGILIASLIISQYFKSAKLIQLSVLDKNEIERVVVESQQYETLVLGKKPESIDENKLAEFWLPDSPEINNLRETNRKMREKGTHYGKSSSCEKLSIVSQVAFSENQVKVLTSEIWYIPKYDQNNEKILFDYNSKGEYVRRVELLERQIEYILRNTNGKWLIESSSTPRIKPPNIENN